MKFLVGNVVIAALLQVTPNPVVAPSLAAESEVFRKLVLRQQPLLEIVMGPTEKLPAYAKYDVSPLWLKTDARSVYGFAGGHYQRLQVKLLTAEKSLTDPTLYYVTGKTRILGVVRAFRGTVRLQQVREAQHRQLPPPEEGRPTQVTASGNMVARYDLFEDSTQAKTGVFRGVVATYWYTDNKRRLHYDDIEGYSDRFTNNQFVGTWTSYATHQSLRCNWGDFRIPNSGDFDIGAGEFSPADQYLTYGWQDVRYAAFGPAEKAPAARLREDRKWW